MTESNEGPRDQRARFQQAVDHAWQTTPKRYGKGKGGAEGLRDERIDRALRFLDYATEQGTRTLPRYVTGPFLTGMFATAQRDAKAAMALAAAGQDKRPSVADVKAWQG